MNQWLLTRVVFVLSDTLSCWKHIAKNLCTRRDPTQRSCLQISTVRKWVDLFWTSTFPTPLCIPVTQMLVPMQHLIQDILPGEPRGFWVVMLVKVLNWGKHFEWARCSHFIDYCVHSFTFFSTKNHLHMKLWTKTVCIYSRASDTFCPAQRPLNHLKSSTF